MRLIFLELKLGNTRMNFILMNIDAKFLLKEKSEIGKLKQHMELRFMQDEFKS